MADRSNFIPVETTTPLGPQWQMRLWVPLLYAQTRDPQSALVGQLPKLATRRFSTLSVAPIPMSLQTSIILLPLSLPLEMI